MAKKQRQGLCTSRCFMNWIACGIRSDGTLLLILFVFLLLLVHSGIGNALGIFL